MLVNVWPDAGGKFSVGANAKTAEVIGFCNEQEDEEDLFQAPSSVLSTGPGPSRSTPRPLAGRRYHHYAAPSSSVYNACRPSTPTGARIPPGVRRTFQGKKKAMTKDVMLSKPNLDTGYPENLRFPVTINLSALPEITVETVAEAVENMLGNGEPVIILNSRGDIIQDMSTTRGPDFWSRQKVFRAMSTEDYQKWRPDVWQHLYQVKTLDVANSSPQEHPLETVEATDKLNAIDDKVTKLLEQSNTIDSVKANFKCLICLEMQYSMMFFCVYGCGRLIGCFTCCYRLTRCPNCRKNLPGQGIRKPLLIPGLAKSLKMQEISREEFEKKNGCYQKPTHTL